MRCSRKALARSSARTEDYFESSSDIDGGYAVTADYFDQEGVLVVQPGKRLDSTSSPEVDREVSARIEAGASRVVFDFQNTEYLSSAGLRVMMKAAKATGKSGGGVGLCGANAHVKQVVELCGMESLFKIAPSLDRAIKLV
ncbi:hypothetical protein CCR91_06825 [Thiorhodovibrio winogradskyi]|nr:STAS domain-containing protein [Thiorhodovibrio winogradskyi]MBK5968492.1 hypothetical protein [Thiorhodovibrio winogradskyi]